MELVFIKNNTQDFTKAYKLSIREHGPAETTYYTIGYLDEWTATQLAGKTVEFLHGEPGNSIKEQKLREINPALMEAWKNYKTVLGLLS